MTPANLFNPRITISIKYDRLISGRNTLNINAFIIFDSYDSWPYLFPPFRTAIKARGILEKRNRLRNKRNLAGYKLKFMHRSGPEELPHILIVDFAKETLALITEEDL